LTDAEFVGLPVVAGHDSGDEAQDEALEMLVTAAGVNPQRGD
jgi:hypothetical protein